MRRSVSLRSSRATCIERLGQQGDDFEVHPFACGKLEGDVGDMIGLVRFGADQDCDAQRPLSRHSRGQA